MMGNPIQSQPDLDEAEFGPLADCVNPGGGHRVVLLCEHASAFIPDYLGNLGITDEAAKSHVAFDPGAENVALTMSKLLDAVLVTSRVSRLVYDCNRPPESPSAIPERSERFDIPGNQNLTAEDRRHRIETFYRPFEAFVESTLAGREDPVLVTIHSFTPVYHGELRKVEIGILNDQDSRLADAMLAVASGFDIRRNAPYGPEDGVTHNLRRHGLRNRILNVMIEIRNDLITRPEQVQEIAECLTDWLQRGLEKIETSKSEVLRS